MDIQIVNISVFFCICEIQKEQLQLKLINKWAIISPQTPPLLSQNTNYKRLTRIAVSAMLELTNVSDVFHPRNYNASDIN